MKKNVLKAMSVGLSAVTIASTLSVPVYADEAAPETTTEPEPISGTAEAGAKDSESEKVKKPSAEEKIAEHSEKFYEHMNDDFNEWDRGKDGGVSQIVNKIGEAKVDEPVYDRDENPDLVDHVVNAHDNLEGGGASPAASSSEDLKDHTNELNQADKKIDRALSEAGNAVGIGEKAVTDAETIVAGAETAVEEAVVAVRDDSIPDAQIVVNDAKGTLDQAEKDFETQKGLVENARLAFEAALTAKETAEKEYNTALTKSKEMAETAKKELEKSQEELWKAKNALDKATYEFSQSAAAALLKAEFDKNVWHNNAAYVQAIIENYIVEEGETVSVKAIKDGDAKFDVTFTNKEDGTTRTVKYGYTVGKDGTVEVFEAEKMYSYGDQKITETQFKELEEAGKAVKRYLATYWNYGRPYSEYLTEKEFAEKKPRVYKEEIVILEDSKTISWTDSDPSKCGYTKTDSNVEYEGFDAYGNYVKIIKNDFEKTVETTVNGKTIKVDKYIKPTTSSDDNSDIIAEAINRIQAEVDKQKKELEELGYIKPELTVDLTDEDVQEKIVDVIWTIDGKYVPVYEIKGKYEVKKETFEEKNHKSQSEAEEAFTRAHPDCIIVAITEIPHDNGNGKGKGNKEKNKKFTITFVRTYDVSEKDKKSTFESKEDALNKVSASESGKHNYSDGKGKQYKSVGIETGKETKDERFLSKLNTEGKYKYTFNPVYNVSYTKTTEQTESHYTLSQVVSAAFENVKSIFKSTDEKYLAKVAEAQAKQDAIANLNKELWDANIAVGAARCEVTAIENELKKLKEKSPLDHVAEITELELNLQNAETELGKKEERLTEAKNRWTQANADLLARIAAQNQNQGGGEEERSYTYNPNVIPTIASIPAVTLPDAGVPLAATRRVRRVAGVEEVEATEETVEETTPEETTEVTVTETEENPVVIDDEDVARAGGTQRSFFARTWWAWLLLVIAAIGGAVAYTKKKATDLK